MDERFTDPAIIGPGVWFSIHLKAKNATDSDKINSFIEYMFDLSEKFPCKKCRSHIQEYMNSHSFDDLKSLKNEDGTLIGMFKWAWMFHNAVNARLGKPYIDWETAWSMYDSDIEICSKNCSESDKSDQNNSSNSSDKIENFIPVINKNIDDSREKIIAGFFRKNNQVFSNTNIGY